MYVLPDKVEELTGIGVTRGDCMIAQAVIEAVTGKVEERVESAQDFELLTRATAYQSVYIAENRDTVFKQVRLRMLRENDYQVSFPQESMSPFIAPLAEFALRNLSWLRTRSISIAPNQPRRSRVAWEKI